jgi:hypothetical protein
MLLLASTTLPPADDIRKAVQEIVARPYYEIDTDVPSMDGSLMMELIRWIIAPFKWLFDSMEGLPESLRWVIVIFCVVLCIALIAHMVYSFVVAIRGPIVRRDRVYMSAGREIDPAELEEQAELAGAAGDYIGAVRLLFRAALRRIEMAEKKKLRPGFTNRELLRRYRASPLANSLQRFVDVIELKWYGDLPCERADYLACQTEHVRIRQYVGTPAVAT